MMQVKFPDIEEYVTQKLAAQYPAYDVGTEIPSDESLRGNRVLAVQRIAGTDFSDVRQDVIVGINVYAPTWTEACDIALDIEAISRTPVIRDGDTVRRVRIATPPLKITGDAADQRIPSYYLAIQCRLRGAAFNPPT